MYDFQCLDCTHEFEQITSKEDPDFGKCPKCGSNHSEKQVPAFRVGGRGDLREHTMHGCHGGHVDGPADAGHSHDHDHDHD